jgi:hypothetical protein
VLLKRERRARRRTAPLRTLSGGDDQDE